MKRTIGTVSLTERGDDSDDAAPCSTSTTTVSTATAVIGMIGSSFTLRDAWTNATSTTTGAISASLSAHGAVVYRVSGGGTAPDGNALVIVASGSRTAERHRQRHPPPEC